MVFRASRLLLFHNASVEVFLTFCIYYIIFFLKFQIKNYQNQIFLMMRVAGLMGAQAHISGGLRPSKRACSFGLGVSLHTFQYSVMHLFAHSQIRQSIS